MYVQTQISNVVFDVQIETSTPRIEKVIITIGGETVDFTQLFCDNNIDEYILDKFDKQIRQYNHEEESESIRNDEV